MLGTQARAVESKLICCGFTHLDGRVERSVVNVGPKTDDQRGQIETVVIHCDHRSRSNRTAGTLPEREAAISGVSPSVWVRFGSAPAFKRRSTISASPVRLASSSGVTP